MVYALSSLPRTQIQPAPLSHTNGTTFRRTNCQLLLKRSGIPSRLSLRRQWITSLLKAFLAVCFGKSGLYLLFGIRLLHHNKFYILPFSINSRLILYATPVPVATPSIPSNFGHFNILFPYSST